MSDDKAKGVRPRLVGLRVEYSDGGYEHYSFKPMEPMVGAETFYASGELKTAGDISRGQLAEELSREVLGGSLGERVVDLLLAMGIDASWEYPGYVDIPVKMGTVQPEGWSWVIGQANEFWDGTITHGESGESAALDADEVFDTTIPSEPEECAQAGFTPRDIAHAIAEHVVEVSTRGLYRLKPSNDAVCRALNYAMAQWELIAAQVHESDRENELCMGAHNRALMLIKLAGCDLGKFALNDESSPIGDILMKAKARFLSWVAGEGVKA